MRFAHGSDPGPTRFHVDVTGTLNITTVFADDPGAKTFRAVRARHDYLPMSLPGYQSEPSVSQHYGTCEAK